MKKHPNEFTVLASLTEVQESKIGLKEISEPAIISD